MKDDRDKVDEEKANDCPIDINYVTNADFKDTNNKANAHHKSNIYNFRDIDLSSIRLW